MSSLPNLRFNHLPFNQSINKTYKVCFFGPTNVGKSSILYYLKNGCAYYLPTPTIGASFMSHRKQIDSHTVVTLELWDTAGHPRFHNLLPMYLRGASAIFLVYDISANESIDETIEHWLPYLEKNKDMYNDKAIKYLVGNKIDLLTDQERERKINDGQKLAKANGCHYLATSALTGDNLNNFFDELIFNLTDVDPTGYKKDDYIENLQLERPTPRSCAGCQY